MPSSSVNNVGVLVNEVDTRVYLATVNDAVSMRCDVSGTIIRWDHYPVIWLGLPHLYSTVYTGSIVSPAYSATFSVSQAADNVSVLTITAVQANDGGKYTCKPVGTNMEQSHHLIVLG